MIDRRNLMAGLGCVSALGIAEYLRPRGRLVLMPEGRKLTDVIPEKVGAWSAGYGGDIVVPHEEDSLASKIYNDRLARIYRDDSGRRPDIMVLAAYGQTQNDTLQVHRPEVCYPANGYAITDQHMVDIRPRAGKPIPAVALTGHNGHAGRTEDIIYWTRMGNALPRTAGEQRIARYEASFAGYVGDGLLFRASAVRAGRQPQFDAIGEFLGELIDATSKPLRVVLVGQDYTAA